MKRKKIAKVKLKELLLSSIALDREEGLIKLQELGPILPLSEVCHLGNDRDANARERFYETVEIYGRDVTQQIALNGLKDKNRIVRLTAAELLITFPPKGNKLKKLVTRLCDPDALMRSRIAEIFGRAGERRFVPILWHKLASERSSHAKVGFFEALNRLGKPDSLEALFKLLDSRNYQVRCATVRSLERLINKTNVIKVKRELKRRLAKEKTVAVKSSIKSVLKMRQP